MVKGKQTEGERKGMGRDPRLDSQLARALNHPTRVRILAVLNERTASPKDLEAVLGIHLSNIAYHCRELLRFGCIEVVGTEQIRGAVKTSYRATTRMLLDDRGWAELSPETRNGISIAALGEVIERAAKAIEAGTFDRRTDRHVVTMKFDADEQAWSEVAGIVEETYHRLADVEAEAAKRQGDKLRVTVSLLSYESPQEAVT